MRVPAVPYIPTTHGEDPGACLACRLLARRDRRTDGTFWNLPLGAAALAARPRARTAVRTGRQKAEPQRWRGAPLFMGVYSSHLRAAVQSRA